MMSDLATTTSLERTSLEAHVDMCAMRYGQLDQRLQSLETKMDAIQQDIVQGQRSTRSTTITSAATILSGLLALALAIYLN